jgi:hypothetical protein
MQQLFGSQEGHVDLAQPVVDLDELVSRTHQVNEFRYALGMRIYANPYSRGLEKAEVVRDIHEQQEAWLDLGVDYAVHAAQLRGGELRKVPFLEPKPITVAEIEYPFEAIL